MTALTCPYLRTDRILPPCSAIPERDHGPNVMIPRKCAPTAAQVMFKAIDRNSDVSCACLVRFALAFAPTTGPGEGSLVRPRIFAPLARFLAEQAGTVRRIVRGPMELIGGAMPNVPEPDS